MYNQSFIFKVQLLRIRDVNCSTVLLLFCKTGRRCFSRATITSDKRFPPHSLVFPTRTKLFQPNLISRKMLQTRVVLQTDVAKPETGSKLRTSRNHIELSIRCNCGQFGLYLQSWYQRSDINEKKNKVPWIRRNVATLENLQTVWKQASKNYLTKPLWRMAPLTSNQQFFLDVRHN